MSSLSHWLNSFRTQCAFIEAVHEFPMLSHTKKWEKKKIWFCSSRILAVHIATQNQRFRDPSSTKLHFAWKWSIEKKIRKTSFFCTQRKYLEFPVRKCSIYQLEDTAENEGCGRFCYHTHFLTKILFKYIGLTVHK